MLIKTNARGRAASRAPWFQYFTTQAQRRFLGSFRVMEVLTTYVARLCVLHSTTRITCLLTTEMHARCVRDLYARRSRMDGSDDCGLRVVCVKELNGFV